jgi:hypothetical protein
MRETKNTPRNLMGMSFKYIKGNVRIKSKAILVIGREGP